MSKGYWIARVDVYDAESYKKYAIANQVAFKKYGAKYLVRAGEFTLKDGASRSRNIVIEFPTFQAAQECWDSPEYKQAASLRAGVASADIIIIEGYDGAQP